MKFTSTDMYKHVNVFAKFVILLKKKLLDVQSILEYKEHATKVKNLSFFQENSFLKIYQTESVECIDLFSVTKS